VKQENNTLCALIKPNSSVISSKSGFSASTLSILTKATVDHTISPDPLMWGLD